LIFVVSRRDEVVADQTYGISEIVGTSPDSLDQAIRNGVAKAAQTVRNLDWFEVSSIRGQLGEGQVAHFQVQMKVGFRIE
jgi:flavin-binding protein dodecin